MDIQTYICLLSTDRYLSGFHFLASMNNVSGNIYVQYFLVDVYFQLFWVYT